MALRRRKRGSRGLQEAAMPSLNSLMDVVTIILVYFVKTFAVSPLSVQDPSVQLPISSSQENPNEAIVVMVTGSEKRGTGPNGEPVAIPDVPTIVVDDDVIMSLDQNFKVPKGQLEGQFVIRTLKQRLLEVKKMQNVTAELMENDDSGGKIVIVADKNVPFELLSRVMVSAAQAGFPEFKFAIVKSGG